MGDMVLRNLEESLKRKLRVRAAENGRSMSAEAQAILRETLMRPDAQPNAEFIRRAAALRERTRGTVQTPSEQLLRESRDTDAR